MIRVTDGLQVDEGAIEERFVRASGPGGQNVNKVATSVQLRFDARVLPDAVRERLVRIAGRRITGDGVVVIEARRFRTRERNREDARARLLRLLRTAAEAPRPRRRTRPSAGSKERRLDEKRRRSLAKEGRRPVSPAD